MIEDFDSLVSEIKVFVARSDSTFSARIQTFISLAEDRIFNGAGVDIRDPLYSPAIRVREMQTAATVSFTDGVGTVPTDSVGLSRVSRATDKVGLDYMPPDAFAQRAAYADTGNPRWYTIETGQIKVAPSGYDGDLTVVYYARPAGVTSTNISNDVLLAYPNLYLAACLFEAFTFIRDGESATGWLTRYRSSATGVNMSATGVRAGGNPLRIIPRNALP